MTLEGPKPSSYQVTALESACVPFEYFQEKKESLLIHTWRSPTYPTAQLGPVRYVAEFNASSEPQDCRALGLALAFTLDYLGSQGEAPCKPFEVSVTSNYAKESKGSTFTVSGGPEIGELLKRALLSSDLTRVLDRMGLSADGVAELFKPMRVLEAS